MKTERSERACYKKKTPQDVYPESYQFVKNLRVLCTMYDVSDEKMMRTMELTRDTFYRRLRSPWTFRLAEIRAAADILGVQPSEMLGKMKFVAEEEES